MASVLGENGTKRKANPSPMPAAAKELLMVKPQISAPLDPNFSPLVLGKRAYKKAAEKCTSELQWALPRADGCGRGKIKVFDESDPNFEASVYLAGVLIQEMIYQRGAESLLLFGPEKICELLKAEYSEEGAYEFETKFMPISWSGKPWETKIVKSAKELPKGYNTPQKCGKTATGCRLAYDLGKSDIKTVAVKDNEILYSKETEWDVTNPDPEYHFKAVTSALKIAMNEAYPDGKVDAVGGSTTGTVTADSKAIWCDLFPNVSQADFQAKIVDFHHRVVEAVAGKVPMKTINDGEVTALAAVQKLGKTKCLGISMGSTEGAGYADKKGDLLGWMNEFGFYKIDLNPDATKDPWTEGHHTGCSHLYLGQRAVSKLAHKVCEVPPNMVYPHPDMLGMYHALHADCLKLVQAAMKDPKQEAKVSELYETIGVYLGYALAQYSEFYEIDHLMILGRVTKGKGGEVMLATARKVLEKEFPELKIELHTADDHFKAVGQCIAAASLPIMKKLRKPKFGKVGKTRPEQKGLNFFVKCVKDAEAVEGTDAKEALCGDETGTIVLSMKSDAQVALCKAGASLRVQNAHVRMIKGHIRLIVDKWAVLKSAESLDFETVDEKNNVSAVEYELK